MICSATKADGTPCTLQAGPGAETCHTHNPAYAERRRKSASRAGKTKPSRELTQIKTQLKSISDRVLEGSLSTGKGSVAAQVLGVYLRAVEQERKMRELDDLQGRIEALEDQIKREAEREKTSFDLEPEWFSSPKPLPVPGGVREYE